MKAFPQITIAALAVATCLSAAAPAQTPAQTDADNPPIETMKTATGESIRVQRFQRPAFDIDPTSLRIAQRKMVRATFGGLVGPALIVRVECPAMASGRLEADLNCRAASGAESDVPSARLATRLMRMTGGAFPPTIPEVPVSSLRSLRRLIQFDVRIAAFPATEPDPPAGPLVDAKEVNGLSFTRTTLDFPANARRAGAGGRMVALCQVQADLSVACKQESFDPPQYAEMFAPAATSLFQAGRVDPLLSSGAKAEGAQFRYSVNFALGK